MIFRSDDTNNDAQAKDFFNELRVHHTSCFGVKWRGVKTPYLAKGANPFSAMVRYKEIKCPATIFTPEQIAKMLNQADNTLRPFLAIGAFAGLCKNELQQLDWNEINLERGFITVAAHKAKTRQRRLVPISDNLKLWLQPLARKQGPVPPSFPAS